MSTQAMSPVDAAWHLMDDAANPAIVTGSAILAKAVNSNAMRRAALAQHASLRHTQAVAQ